MVEDPRTPAQQLTGYATDPYKYSVVYDKKKRIAQELRNAGVTKYGLLKMAARYLPNIIHGDEHIQGVIYGRSPEGRAMIVATDHRVIFIDKKPLFINFDELTYDVVSGVSYGQSWMFMSVTLHTRLKDYTLSFVNPKCAHYFVRFIEANRLEHDTVVHMQSFLDRVRGV